MGGKNMSNVLKNIMGALAKPFPAANVEWRIQHATQDKKKGLAVPYVQSRAIQSRLDEVVGPYNWKTEYKPWHSVNNAASQLCGLSIYCEERKEWIQKWDGAENTDIEPVKGGISDSFKRAAVLWGIGRYLYGLAAVWVEIEQRGKSYAISDSGLKQLNGIYEKAVKALASGSPAPPAPAAPPPEPLPFEYAVRTVEQRQFASGNGMVLQLKSADGKKNVEAFLQKSDSNLSEGVCLKNVKLVVVSNNGHKCNIMETYEVA
jgi:hypothetical protein